MCEYFNSSFCKNAFLTSRSSFKDVFFHFIFGTAHSLRSRSIDIEKKYEKRESKTSRVERHPFFDRVLQNVSRLIWVCYIEMKINFVFLILNTGKSISEFFGLDSKYVTISAILHFFRFIKSFSFSKYSHD